MTLEDAELTGKGPHLAPWQFVVFYTAVLGHSWRLGFQTSLLWVSAAANVLICPSITFKLGRQSNRCILNSSDKVSISKCREHLGQCLILKRFTLRASLFLFLSS